MFNKSVLIILFTLILIIGTISAVNANDLNQSAEISTADVNDDIYQNSDVEVAKETQKTFIDLNKDINGNYTNEVYLNHDYTFNSDLDAAFTDGITISRAVTIWGNGHTLDGNNAARILNVTTSNVAFHDIVFTNGKTKSEGGAIYGGGTAVNCTFIGNYAGFGGATYGGTYINCSFDGNTAEYSGGAGCGGSFENCNFTGNTAHYYGGAYYNGGNMATYSIVNCNFVENRADVGGAINVQFSGTSVSNCNFTRNVATWEGGAIYDVYCNNCTFSENTADYGGAMKYGTAVNCTFSANHANFGGASYQGTCLNSTFIENYADYGGAIYEGRRTENCRFIGNYAFFGGAIYRTSVFATKNCYFAYNFARNGGATYQVEAENCFFANNEATEYGGAMYGESATNCTFQDNKANITGNDAFNSEIKKSTSNITNASHIIYFDANAAHDGDGSENNPYKYLYPDRISSVVTAYFAEGTYELNSTCTITGAKLIGMGIVRIVSKVSNQYDFIIKENSYFELNGFRLINVNILNQAALYVENTYFEGTDIFDQYNLPKIESGSGLFDSSYGGVIVCDSPKDSKSTLILNGCTFNEVYDAFNGGVIAAINSDISISKTVFNKFSSTYKGGAIYTLNSNLNIYNSQFIPATNSKNEDSSANRQGIYTSYYGGSIYCENSNMLIDCSKFDGSISFSFGGCIASLNSNITIRESDFNNSLSLSDGGGAIYNSKSELYIFNSKFFNNSAEFGGAVCNINSILKSYRSTYSNNHANHYGGVIYDIYGTLNFFRNQFYVSRALVGGTIYTRIPNDVILVNNFIGDSFAKEGSSIFYDGKKENEISNYYGNDYHVFAEFRATLNGEDYYIISNPLYYQLSSSATENLYFPYHVYRVSDDLVTMMIYGTDDDRHLTSIATDYSLNNISVNISFSDEFINPTLNVYLFEDLNIELYNNYGSEKGNLYTGSRDKLFNIYSLVESYSIDLSENNNYNFTAPCTIDFSNSFLKIKYDNLYEAASFNPVSLINNSFLDYTTLPSQIDVLSEYYNSNDYGLVSSVKDQKNGGNCWAFSGIATLETCLSKATGINYEFSVENAKNLMAAYSVYGIKIETNYAGYESMLVSYLTSWLGPIDESFEGYDDYSSISILESPMFHIQNVKFLPARLDSSDNYLYKLAIRDNGAVSVTFKWGDDFHSVSLVGWDDNYVGYDSLGKLANGAWIFKNSWGPDWENNGFGYLSYDEKISEQIYPNLHAYTFVFNDNNPYTKIYQYDFAGVSEFYHYMDSISFKNTFTADKDSLLSAFSTYFDRQTNFTVSVYKNNQFVFSQNGTASAGYYTIPFTTQIQLDEGDEFSIAINNHNKGYNCIPVCSAEEITKRTFSQNVSFISLDGENWFDLYDYADSCNVACIKAFTQNINLTSIKLNIDEFDSVNTKNFNIKVDLDNVDVNAINYCLMKFTIDGKTYYAQIRNGAAILNVNLDEGEHTLFAQYKDNVFESNIIQFNFTVKHDESNQSFNAIQDLINNADDNSNINLNHNYIYNEKFDNGEYGVHVNKTITINGNGHSIDGVSKATGFYVSANHVVLNDLIFNNTFSANGGGVYIAARNVTLNNCTFINCMATQYGGGIYSLFDINLNDCKFINNSANMGGGLYLITSTSSNIENCYFNDNTAQLHGSAAYIEGVGSIFTSSTNFTNNNAKYNGGAVFSSNYNNSFSNCIFENNSANSGGAVFSNANLNEFNECVFSENIAEKSGGAITSHNKVTVKESNFNNNTVIVQKQSPIGDLGGGAIYSTDDLNIHNSIFTSNNAGYGGALYTNKYLKIYKTRFINNTASISGGASYGSYFMEMKSGMFISLFSEVNIYDSYFESNSAPNGGAINTAELAENCTFISNRAQYGGAIDEITTVKGCNFENNSALYTGGAINIQEYMTSSIENSRFNNNSAQFGGAILAYSDREESMANMSIYKCSFTSNNASKSGGAIYSDGLNYIESSDFANNTAQYGSAIYSKAYLNLKDSNITSTQNITPVHFSYHYINETSAYGDLYLKNNTINSPTAAIYYDENEIIFKSVLLLVFNNTRIIKGQSVNVAHLEDMDGNKFYAYGTGDLEITLTDQNNNKVRFTLPYDRNLEGYVLDTSLLNYATYRLEGKLSNNYPVCIAKPATLTVTDANGRTSPAILPSEITTEYAKSKIAITLKDPSGKAIANSEVNVNFNGKTLTLKTSKAGQVILNYKLVPGDYIAFVSFKGNKQYTATNKMVMVSVKKATPKITASKKTFKVKVKTKKYTVSLKNNLGKAMKNVKVTIKIKGKTYKAKTNSKGKATFKLKLTKKGKFTATVKYAGNKYYAKISKKVKITVK